MADGGLPDWDVRLGLHDRGHDQELVWNLEFRSLRARKDNVCFDFGVWYYCILVRSQGSVLLQSVNREGDRPSWAMHLVNE